jgi:hypothetical protein
VGRSPVGKFFQGFPPRKQGLHHHEPTQHETVTTFPMPGMLRNRSVTNRGK